LFHHCFTQHTELFHHYDAE